MYKVHDLLTTISHLTEIEIYNLHVLIKLNIHSIISLYFQFLRLITHMSHFLHQLQCQYYTTQLLE